MKITGPLFSLEASKQFGNTIVFKTKNGKSFATKYSKPSSVRKTSVSASQLRERAIYSEGIEAWRALSDSQKFAYNENAKDKEYSGYNFFMKKWINNYTPPVESVFGHTSAPTGAYWDSEDQVIGSSFIIPNSGIVSSISVFVLQEQYDDESKVKCGIYKTSDGSFVAETEERVFYAGENYTGRWEDFHFVSSPALIGGEYYTLVMWTEYYSLHFVFDVGISGDSKYKNASYGVFPPAIIFTNTAKIIGIYATYMPN